MSPNYHSRPDGNGGFYTQEVEGIDPEILGFVFGPIVIGAIILSIVDAAINRYTHSGLLFCFLTLITLSVVFIDLLARPRFVNALKVTFFAVFMIMKYALKALVISAVVLAVIGALRYIFIG